MKPLAQWLARVQHAQDASRLAFPHRSAVTMGIRFTCPHCQRRLNVKSFLAGKRGLCPKCGGKIRIPTESQLPQQPKTAAVGGVAAGSDEMESPATGRSGAGTGLKRDSDWYPFELVQQGASAPPAETRSSPATVGEEEAVWYVSPPGGGQFGPASRQTVEQWISEGRVTAETLVWREGWEEWQMAGRHFVQLQLEERIEMPLADAPESHVSPDVPSTPAPVAALSENRLADVGSTMASTRRSSRRRSLLWVGIFALLAVLLVGTLALILILGS